MRDIKFRAYIKPYHDKDASYCINMIGLIYNVKEILFADKIITVVHSFEETFDFQDVELMQYTGFKDIYDKEIYEGDIVKYCERNYRIAMIKGMFLRVTANIGIDISQTLNDSCSDCEIIGNIYQHQELARQL